MKVEKVAVAEINLLSKLLENYINEAPEISHLYDYSKNINEFKQIIADKKKEKIDRKILVRELKKQYQAVENSSEINAQIDLLAQENTFTVTTAHQLCLFTGPLYFIYKAISTIKLALLLKEKYPENNFVPIFWLGSEDHDFEEINHLNIYGKKIEWESGQTGAVGRMKNTNMSKVISEISKVLFNRKESDLVNKLNKYFKENDTYAHSFINYLHHLFGCYGLVVFDQDNFYYKKLFADVMAQEMFNGLVENSIQKEVHFLAANFKVQAKPRSINLFYMKDDLRERIEQNGNGFSVVNTEIYFTENELSEELKNYPDRFSPNVLLRPLYQESILPNLAYIGGGGELAYWLELRQLFHSQARKMPMLLLRDMATVIDTKTAENIEKLLLDKKCLFKNKELLMSEIVKSSSSNNLSLELELNTLKKMYKSVLEHALKVDKSLELHVLAQEKKMLNSMQNIEQKMLRAEKKNQVRLMAKIEAVKVHLFPKGKLQERYNNFLPLYKKYDKDFLDLLLENFNPLTAEMKLVYECKS